MAVPRVIILRAPGTNCDWETAYAFELANAISDLVHINRLLENPWLLGRYQILCIPGGFSYGDDIAAGRILASNIRLRLMDALLRFKADGKLILGICNGFQVLLKAGLLLCAADRSSPIATLSWNDSGRFEDRWVNLAVCGNRTVFLDGIRRLYLPVAHAEGKFAVCDAHALQELEAAGRLVLRYVNPRPGDSNQHVPYPFNPNGSMGNVAGTSDETGRVFGMMPHPERYIDRTQHPRWTREDLPESGDGLRIFQNAAKYFAD
jgi:phosphoribosylformylglycinamidine synthase